MKFASVQLSDSDVIEIKYNKVEPTREQFETYLDEILDLVKKFPGTGQLYDGTHIKLLPAEMRIRHGKWIKENEDLFISNVTVSAFVIPNMLARMVLRGVFLIQKPVTPYTIVSSREEGLAYIKSNARMAS
ncbi:MAG: hypothetical protein AAFQ98_22130 [Bacteroidota bacterium]